MTDFRFCSKVRISKALSIVKNPGKLSVIGATTFSTSAVYRTLWKETHSVNQTLSNLSVEIVDKYSFFCDDAGFECLFYGEYCSALRYDELHLTVEGLQYYGEHLVRFLCGMDDAYCLSD